MTSVDTNILFHAYDASSPNHSASVSFLESLYDRRDVVVSEFVLVELYRLLRNPVVVERPLSEGEAVAVIRQYRTQTQWRVVGFPAVDSRGLHDALWKIAGASPFAYRRIYDARLALTLQSEGVDEFATCNTKDFSDLGFDRVWNPLTERTTH